MIFRFLIIAIILIGMFVLLYKLLENPKKKKVENSNSNWLKPFNKPIFKIPIGILIITATLIFSFNLVKVLPIIMKVGVIGLDFVIIYIVFNYLFINKQKTN